MAKKPRKDQNSLHDDGIALGQMADGTITSMSPEEWAKRKAELDEDNAAFDHAMATVYGNEDDISDLD